MGDKRKTHEFPGLGKLVPYVHGRGYTVVPLRGGNAHARRHGMGLADTLAKGKASLVKLDSWRKMGECYDCGAPAPRGLYQCGDCLRRAQDNGEDR